MLLLFLAIFEILISRLENTWRFLCQRQGQIIATHQKGIDHAVRGHQVRDQQSSVEQCAPNQAKLAGRVEKIRGKFLKIGGQQLTQSIVNLKLKI